MAAEYVDLSFGSFLNQLFEPGQSRHEQPTADGDTLEIPVVRAVHAAEVTPQAQAAIPAELHQPVLPTFEKFESNKPRLFSVLLGQEDMPIFYYPEGGKDPAGMNVRDYGISKHPFLRQLIRQPEGAAQEPRSVEAVDFSVLDSVEIAVPVVTKQRKVPRQIKEDYKTPRAERTPLTVHFRRAKMVGVMALATVSLVGGYKAGGGGSLYDGSLLSVPHNIAADLKQAFTEPLSTVSAQLTRIRL